MTLPARPRTVARPCRTSTTSTADAGSGNPTGLGSGRYSGQTFVIYCGARTGSNLLISLLNTHPDLLCHYELFNAQAVFTGLAEKRLRPPDPRWLHDLAARDPAPGAFLDRLYALGEGHAAQGFKLLAGQGGELWRQTLADPASKSLILKRKDLVKAFVSERIARKTGGWTRDDEQRLGISQHDRRVRFDPHAFRLYLLRTGAYYAAVEAALAVAGKDYQVIYYEDLTASTDAALARIAGYLGVTVAGFEPGRCWFSRQNPEPVSELVTNPAQMVRFLSGTDVTALFDGGGRAHRLWLAAVAALGDCRARLRRD